MPASVAAWELLGQAQNGGEWCLGRRLTFAIHVALTGQIIVAIFAPLLTEY